MTAEEIAVGVGKAWASHLTRSQRPQTPHPYVYASGYRVCERRMAYDMSRPEKLPPWPAEVLAKFRRGDDRERDLLADLTRIGRDADPPFSIEGQQERFQLKDRKGRIAVVGKVDARIKIADRRPPIEVKAWSPMMTDRIERFEDLFDNPWTVSGAHQLLGYLFGAGEPFGFLLLDRSGIPRLLPVELEPNLDRMEDFLSKSERAIDHVEAGTLPPFLEDDPNECKRCAWYGGECNPNLSAVGAQVLTDPELEIALLRRNELEAAADEFDRLDKRIKQQLRGVLSGIAGPFQITGKWSKSSRVVLPEDLKKKYTETKAQGKFTLEIVKLGDATPAPATEATT